MKRQEEQMKKHSLKDQISSNLKSIKNVITSTTDSVFTSSASAFARRGLAKRGTLDSSGSPGSMEGVEMEAGVGPIFSDAPEKMKSPRRGDPTAGQHPLQINRASGKRKPVMLKKVSYTFLRRIIKG